MQRVTVANIKTKTGTGGRGPWTLVILTGDDGAEFTSFDKALENLSKGTIIELEPEITTKDGKTKVNIKEWKLISEGTPPAPAGDQQTTEPGGERGGGGYKNAEIVKFEELGRRYRQNVDRLSIERQSAYNGAISLIPHYASIKLQPEAAIELNGLILEALKWGRQAITATATLPEQKSTEAQVNGTGKGAQKPATTDVALPVFKDGIELVNFAIKQGWRMDRIKETLSINNPTEIKDVKAAAAVLFSGKAKAKDPNDPEGIFSS